MNNVRELQGSQEKAFGDWELQAHAEMNLRRDPMRQEKTPRVQGILESLANVFYALDGKWRFIYFNYECTWDDESRYKELLGRVVWDAFPTVRGSTFESECRRTMREQTATHFEMHSPGSERWFEVHAYPTAERLWLCSHDITVRKDAEAEGQRLLQEAKEANRLKDDFLTTVAHELRSPLNAVMGWANLLRSGELDEAEQARGVETIERSARAQAQIIEDILDISRVISGKLRLETQPMDLVDVLKVSLDATRPAAETKGLQLCLEAEAIGDVMGDPNRLQQVFCNLLSNAVKFTPRGGQVRVALQNLNNEVRVMVIDTGQGIPTEFLPFIFERFQQADKTGVSPGGGLGLGLSIVRQLVELHGGRVWAEGSGTGQGATFIVSLPSSP